MSSSKLHRNVLIAAILTAGCIACPTLAQASSVGHEQTESPAMRIATPTPTVFLPSASEETLKGITWKNAAPTEDLAIKWKDLDFLGAPARAATKFIRSTFPKPKPRPRKTFWRTLFG